MPNFFGIEFPLQPLSLSLICNMGDHLKVMTLYIYIYANKFITWTPWQHKCPSHTLWEHVCIRTYISMLSILFYGLRVQAVAFLNLTFSSLNINKTLKRSPKIDSFDSYLNWGNILPLTLFKYKNSFIFPLSFI